MGCPGGCGKKKASNKTSKKITTKKPISRGLSKPKIGRIVR